MGDIIASTYELIQEIGSGGGGIVYLANHLRLDKRVVLKADKRKITTSPELLRREVDILKDLTHSYIPKVFDFFAENDTVYTVMDYIEGESLDKPLKRGEKFPQPQVIEWGRQLLQALDYLHSPTHGTPPRGYVHSDIKPANLMRTPYNEICLIDFNIALALGEKNVIGCSAGYASPEHYGLDYSGVDSHTGETTVLLSPEEMDESLSVSSVSQKKIMPDVRSDIYSVGATLYHLFSGRRPAREATEVTPLTYDEVSPQISQIIAKAMCPNPDERYQTAAEMLYAFDHLRENDSRTKKHRRSCIITAAVLAALLCAGTFTAFTGLKRMQSTENWLKLAEYSSNAYEEGNVSAALSYAMEAFPEKRTIFTPNELPEARAALTDALGVYSLSDGYAPSGVVTLPSVPLCMRISSDGSTGACICSGKLVIFDTRTAEITAQQSADVSALSEVEFIGNNRVVFAGEDGLTVLDTQTGDILWKGKPATAIAVSSDGSTIAGVYKDESAAYIYDGESGELIKTVGFGERKQPVKYNDTFSNPSASVFALSHNGKYLAVSFEDGNFVVFDLTDDEGGIWIFDETQGYSDFDGGFCGDYLGFSAKNSNGTATATVIDCEKKEIAVEFNSDDRYTMSADEGGIYIQAANILVKIDPLTGEQTPLVNTSLTIRRFDSDGEYTLISDSEGFSFFGENGVLLSDYKYKFNADFLVLAEGSAIVGSGDSNTVRILTLNNHSDSNILTYDYYPHFEARLSADEQRIMLFSYESFRILDRDGEIIADIMLPDPDVVYDTQFRRNEKGSYLEVTYYSGRVLCYSADDGTVIDEYSVEPPDTAIVDEFLTDRLRIESPLHGAPKAYDRESGEFIKELESDAYLMYVTQTEEYVAAQYMTTDGNYYGVLMNDKCETIARLPALCDIVNEKFIFDYHTGNLRESRIYKINELISMARKVQEEKEK